MKILKRPTPKKRLKATAQRAAGAFDSDDFADSEPSMRLSRAFIVVLLLHVVAVGGILAFNRMEPSAHPAKKASPPKERTATGSPTVRIHYLRKNETLADVASAYGVPAAEIELASGLKPGAAIPPGQEIRIPERSETGPLPLDIKRLVEAPRTPPKDLSQASMPKPASTRTTPPKTSIQETAKVTSPAKTTEPHLDEHLAGSTLSLPSGEIYVVAKGDSPATIARKFKVNYDELLKTNKIEDPRRLQIGQKLLIPKAPSQN